MSPFGGNKVRLGCCCCCCWDTQPKRGDREAANENSDLSFHLAELRDTKQPLTCRGDAVETDEGVEAGGGAGQHAVKAERSEAARAKLFQAFWATPEESDTTLAATQF